MDTTFVVFDFDYLHGKSASIMSTCATSVGHIHNWLSSGNSLMMDCRCFCNVQEAIDIIERRVIPSDSYEVLTQFCGAAIFSAITGITVCLHYPASISDNSLFTELSLIVFSHLFDCNKKVCRQCENNIIKTIWNN